MKFTLLAALFLLTSCGIEIKYEPKKESVPVVRKYRVYTSDRGAIYCAKAYTEYRSLMLDDCLGVNGRTYKTIYNATNVTEEEN